MFAESYFLNRFTMRLLGFFISSLIFIFAALDVRAMEDDSNIINKVYDYTQCQTLVLDSSIIVWYQGYGINPEKIGQFTDLTPDESKRIINRKMTLWGLNIDKWRKNILEKVKIQTSIKDILYDDFAWVKAKALDSSDPLKSCVAKIIFDVEFSSSVRVEGRLEIGRYYYFLQKNGTLSLRGPGADRGYPFFVHNRRSKSWIYTSDAKMLTTINKITIELTQNLLDTLTARESK